jgi:hypothetical protein
MVPDDTALLRVLESRPELDEDHSHFSAVFRHAFGVTPSAFRKSTRHGVDPWSVWPNAQRSQQARVEVVQVNEPDAGRNVLSLESRDEHTREPERTDGDDLH